MDILAQVAKDAMIEKDFITDFSPVILKEIPESLNPPLKGRDLRHFPWFSIDNDDSLDLDQLTYAEGDRLYVAVADVDSLVPKDSATDLRAKHNTTSVYTPTVVFPMLPPQYSTHLTSLNANEDRSSIVTEMKIDPDGGFHLTDIYPAIVRNHIKLAYNAVSSWFDHKPDHFDEDLWRQLKLQDEIAQKIKAFRIKQGALQFKTVELAAEIKNGQVVGLQQVVHNRAQELIENFMIAANSCMTKYLQGKNLPVLKRVVKTPKRWDRIVDLVKEYGTTLPDQPDGKALQDFLAQHPDEDLSLALIKLIGRGEYILTKPHEESPGHFDLALHDYAHTTAPNRRFPDLVMQRIAKSSFENKPRPYTDEELKSIAEHCTLKEDDAQRVERRVLKSAAAVVLSKMIGRTFSAMVTGNNEKGAWVRIDEFHIEGKLVDGPDGLDVGDKLQVKLLKTDVKKGFIDFKRVLNSF